MNEEESKRDISSKWLNIIYERLVRLGELEMLMREGCRSVQEFAMNFHDRKAIIPATQIKAMGLFLSEFDMVLSDVKEIISEETYDKLKDRLVMNGKIFSGEKIKVGKQEKQYQVYKNKEDLKHRQYIHVFPIYNIVLSNLVKLREQLVSSLSHILYIKEDKTKKREEV